MACAPNSNIIEEKTKSGIKIIYKPKDAVFSSNQLNIIPNRPDFSIDKETANKLLNFLSGKFNDKEISIELDSSICFVDCGENFEKILCPNCGKEIPGEEWHEAMDKAYEKNFSDLDFRPQCCDILTDLNLLNYQSACGFAKSIITIIDPDIEKLDKAKLLQDIKNICQVDFRIIYAHI